MVNKEVKNPLLLNIKAAVEDIVAADKQTFDTLHITDKLRREILNVLVSYSDKIPHPASGHGRSHDNGNNAPANTLMRWQILAYVASIDLAIVKWFESHLDALSILHEVGYDTDTQKTDAQKTDAQKSAQGSASGLWAVWAAEGPPLNFEQDAANQQDKTSQQGKVNGTVYGIANGIKAWCSGAHIVDYGLMTYRDKNGDSQLLIVDMQQEGIAIDGSSWQAVGMQATDTATIEFTDVAAEQVGAANAYLERVGFWHGAAGVAACWYGATAYLANYLLTSYQHKPNDYKAMYLGEISTAMALTQQYFYYVANLIDSESQHQQHKHSHELAIRALRANVEQLARQVLETTGQALGAAPFCTNAHFARLAADLPVFIRQSHGAFDLQKIGELTSASATNLTSKATGNESKRQENLWQL
ncbi:acyl-CoA dehydrogenase [uncultured Psychrobacter sp.]|uniref:acyl-CoA dehydrogenase n=1 Tax=uncultured Psychrobacter sp. TaxID=259303 RepID=UPI003459192F